MTNKAKAIQEKTIKVPVQSFVQDSMADYSAAVIVDRAIVAIDGLKPVQRRLLYTMNKMGLTKGKHTKLNNVGGQTMLLHPHGDPSASVYPMAAEWLNNVPYANIDGNGGTIVSGISGAAATRYTSGSITEASEKMMSVMKKDAVNMIPSYDGSTVEPVLLPTEFPNLFMNATEGIAVGMSAKIIPHNPREIMEAAIYYMDHPKATPEDFAKIIKGPDFPTGGLLIDSERANLRELKYGRTGKINNDDKENESYIIRGESKIIDDAKEPIIQFTSIPYGVTLDSVAESVKKFSDENTTIPFTDFRDESEDYNKIDIKFIFKKGTPKNILEQTLVLLYKKTNLESSISPNNLIIAQGHPKVVSMSDYFKYWFDFRYDFTKRAFQFDLNKCNNRTEIVDGLLKLIEISDEVVKDARASNGKEDFKKILMKKHHFSAEQSEAIASMQLYRLGKQDFNALTKEKKSLTKEIERLTKFINDDKAFKREIKRQLKEILDTTFKDSERKTKLVKKTKTDNISIDKTAMIQAQDVVIVAKRDGVIQRMSQQVYDNNIDKYENKNKIVSVLNGNTKEGALFFTKDGLAFYRIVDELENQNVRWDPDSVQKVIRSYKSDDETIGAGTFELDKKTMKETVIVSVTKLGMAKVTRVSDVMPNIATHAYYKRTTKYNGLKLSDDEVIFVQMMTEEKLAKTKLKVERDNSKSMTIDLSTMNIQGANGSGSRKVGLKENEQITKIEEVE